MITATKNNLPASTNAFQEAKDKLKKISLLNSNDIKPLPSKQIVQEEQEIKEKKEKKEQQERTLALITYTQDINDIMEHIKKEGFTIVKTKTIQLSLDQAEEFYVDHSIQNYYEKMIRWLSSGSNICALILEKNNAINDWRSLMGPTAYKKARKSNPNSIRALFGKDTSQNATHGSDSEASAKKEIDFIFSDSLLAATTAELHHQQNENIVPVTIETTEEKDVCIFPPSSDDLANEEKEDKKSDSQNVIISEKIITEQKEPVQSVVAVDSNEKVDFITEASKEVLPSANDDKKEMLSVVITNDSAIKTIKEVSSDVHDDKENNSSGIPENKENALSFVTDPTEETISTATTINTQDITITAEEKDVCLPVDIDTLPDDINKENKLPTKNTVLCKDNIQDTPLQENVDNKQDIALKDNLIDDTTHIHATVTESNITQQEPEVKVSDINIPKEETNTCDEITPDPSVKDEEITSNDTITLEQILNNETSSPIKMKTSISDTEVITITPPAELDQTASSTSSENKKIKNPTISVDTKSTSSKRSTTSATKDIKARVKKEAIIPSSSRIRPPSIQRGHNGNMIQSGEPIGRNRITNSRINSANSSAGTTRIARLSPSATMKSEPVIAEKKKSAIATREAPKKPVTKVSKNLPRVAMMAAPKQSTKEEEAEEKKTKKRGSSTKSFISRLTAPTVASQNKKADNDTTATTSSTVSRRTTTSGKRSSAVRPTSSTSKEITTRIK